MNLRSVGRLSGLAAALAVAIGTGGAWAVSTSAEARMESGARVCGYMIQVRQTPGKPDVGKNIAILYKNKISNTSSKEEELTCQISADGVALQLFTAKDASGKTGSMLGPVDISKKETDWVTPNVWSRLQGTHGKTCEETGPFFTTKSKPSTDICSGNGWGMGQIATIERDQSNPDKNLWTVKYTITNPPK